MIYDVRLNKLVFSLRKNRLKRGTVTLFRNRKWLIKKRIGVNCPVQTLLVDVTSKELKL